MFENQGASNIIEKCRKKIYLFEKKIGAASHANHNHKDHGRPTSSEDSKIKRQQEDEEDFASFTLLSQKAVEEIKRIVSIEQEQMLLSPREAKRIAVRAAIKPVSREKTPLIMRDLYLL